MSGLGSESRGWEGGSRGKERKDPDAALGRVGSPGTTIHHSSTHTHISIEVHPDGDGGMDALSLDYQSRRSDRSSQFTKNHKQSLLFTPNLIHAYSCSYTHPSSASFQPRSRPRPGRFRSA